MLPHNTLARSHTKLIPITLYVKIRAVLLPYALRMLSGLLPHKIPYSGLDGKDPHNIQGDRPDIPVNLVWVSDPADLIKWQLAV